MTEDLWDRNAAVAQIDTSQWGDEAVRTGDGFAYRWSGEVHPVSNLALTAVRFTKCVMEAWVGHETEK